MPTTKKESFYFGTIMCFGMVVVMTFYNLYLNGMFGEMTFIAVVTDLIFAFIIALLLDLFLVGPNAKKIALKLTAKSTNKLYTILAISTFMVVGMASFMSIFGLATQIIHTGYTSNFIIGDYLSVLGKNLLMALPLQILIMGPLVRFIFVKYIKSTQTETRLQVVEKSK
ncbi:DUF2798 domain-containing protein [Litchfieldia salsa]|uniref:DUF2798 domain-containing protein n=1 Tax=Litchfieldia salsa TaxID=930152 RepID=A0A1H0PGK7_9BACI|nr:DUF2798 domain-containing protein [Litchfieldia salsa]SDP03788.1 Protein of unknown function [Litchfieldia salsa]